MAEECRISEAIPQLLVAPQKAVEAAKFYESLFDVERTRYNEFPMKSRTSEMYEGVACVEIKIGGSPIVIRDFDSINCRVPRSFWISTCLRIQCVKLELMVAKAVSLGCTILKEILEDPLRPGVMVSVIRDPFGHVWELSDSSYGVSEDGFMNTECMNVLLQGWSKNEREYNQGMFQTYAFTPIVGICEGKKNAADIVPTVRHGGFFDPILFDCKYMAISSWLQEQLNYKGTLVGLADPSTSFKDRERCIEKGADFVVEKPLNHKKVAHILFNCLKKKMKEKMKDQ